MKAQEMSVVLPSDPAWRLSIYLKMIAQQKQLQLELQEQTATSQPVSVQSPMVAPWPDSGEESEAKRPRVSDATVRSQECRRSIQSAGGLSWSSADLALAATLLETPNARFPTITFADLEEKRRVFTLVYDVLRYKSILNQALNDLYFFARNAHLKEHCHLVWLLFFDLYKRDFTVRDAMEPAVAEAWTRQGLHEIDEVLWQLRVKLAATVSRLRIKSGAHSLSELLPPHLRHTRSALEENIVTGWVNVFKARYPSKAFDISCINYDLNGDFSVKEISEYLDDLGIYSLSKDRDALMPLTFKTDHLLPRFLHIMPNLREDVVNSSIVRDHRLIMQERTFCLGPAVIAQLLKDYALSGKVAQTHVNSPITMAYFANLLINNDKIEALLVFGAGYRKDACEQYLNELGIKNTQVFSESFAALPPESRVLDNVIAVLATPPNTNSSVVDPVDLSVARGGDLQILQQLTDTDFSSTPTGEHIDGFLREQRETLRRAMSKPQIQFVLYENHSRFSCENEEMASSIVNDMNNYATEVHVEELRRSQGENQERQERERSQSQVEPSDTTPTEPTNVRIEEELVLPTPPSLHAIVIPPSDLFEVADIPDLCPNNENCLDLFSEGTYIALIKRKEITRLDPKYMIQMAEARGLFGRPEGTPKAKPAGQTARAKAALAALQARSEMMEEKNTTKVKVEMDRIAAPTRASLLRDIHPPSSKDCPRHTHHLAHDGTPAYLTDLYKGRKTYLTSPEEEELIRRLYTCPKVNVFPPRLYEDLPPLKFWSSPASVIESYLLRKVFQRRLQLAYEFNQCKEPGLNNSDDSASEAQKQLTQALVQLTSDMNYFQHMASQQVLKQAQQREIESVQNSYEFQNKTIWGRICPEEEVTTIVDDSLEPELALKDIQNQKRLSREIKNRYINYKDFYKLQNLPQRDKEPLAVTINQTNENFESTSANYHGVHTVCFNDVDSPTKTNEIKKSSTTKKVTLTNASGLKSFKSDRPASIVSFGTLHHVNSSLDSCSEEINLKKTIPQYPEMGNEMHDEETLLPPWSTNSMVIDNFSRKGTVLTMRDSFDLNQKRLLSISKPNLARKNKSKISYSSFASHRDSYMKIASKRLDKLKPDMSSSLSNLSQYSHYPNRFKKSSYYSEDPSPSSLADHRDSIVLTTDKLLQQKSNEPVTCDICNNDFNKPVQFTCNLHSHMYNIQTIKKNHSSIISSRKSYLSHKDSLEVIPKMLSKKEKNISVQVQAEDEDILKNTLPPATFLTNEPPLYLVSLNKGSQKCKRLDPPIEQESTDLTPSKLNLYLMKSMNVNQIVTDDTNKSWI